MDSPVASTIEGRPLDSNMGAYEGSRDLHQGGLMRFNARLHSSSAVET
jgi:hypothetical protein